MSKVLVWKKDEEHPLFSEKSFPIYPMVEVGANRYEMEPDGDLEGVIHPVTNQLIQLKGPFEEYGEVFDSDDAPEHDIFADAEGTPDIDVELVTGTPELGISEEE